MGANASLQILCSEDHSNYMDLGSAEKAARGCDSAALDNLRRLFTHSVIVFRRNSFVVSSSPLNLPKKRGISAEAYISMDTKDHLDQHLLFSRNHQTWLILVK